MTKNNEVIAEKTVSEQCRHQALGRLELLLTLVVNTYFQFDVNLHVRLTCLSVWFIDEGARASEAGVCRGSDTPTIYVGDIDMYISLEKPNTYHANCMQHVY